MKKMPLKVNVFLSVAIFVLLIILSRMLIGSELNNPEAVPNTPEATPEVTGFTEEEIRQYEEEKEEEEKKHQEYVSQGYKAIYTECLSEGNPLFREEYDAKGNSRMFLFEDGKTIRFLVFDRYSANYKCVLYVYYKSTKGPGAWDSILGFYAYEFEKGIVVDGQKSTWEDPGTQEYRDITGE